jgi:cellulose synthase (UDP-forming)
MARQGGPPRAGGSLRREMALTRAAIAFTALAAAGFAATIAVRLGDGAVGARIVETTVYALLVGSLVYGGLVFQVARLGWLRRVAAHEDRDEDEVLDDLGPGAPAVTMLLPSYREEREVVRQALLSCALQRYPRRRVVLLIDDPPAPADAADRAALEAARALPGEVAALLAAPAARCRAAAERLEPDGGRRGVRRVVGRARPRRRAVALADEYVWLAAWLEALAAREGGGDHVARLFAGEVLGGAAAAHRRTEAALRAASRATVVPRRLLDRAAERLAWLLDVELDSFERKRYANLSHAPNKAMNLNAAIGLIGRGVREVPGPDGLELVADDGHPQAVRVPDAEFVLTLDADSLLLGDYTARLVELMRRPGNERVAVAQTPYSAVPGPATTIERIAGATTDMQYIVHQGFTAHGATFWVGANALLRKAALDDIRQEGVDEDGRAVVRYVQDRTVIEDTESSVDLVARGWQLVNYPRRLSYSATPPDYGALVIQRRRWANGGLLILPKLARYLASRRRVVEGWMRLHYLASIALANVALLALLTYPFDDSLATVWLPATALPYFALYARDLSSHGYRRGDVVRVYALNVLLVAANLGGVLKSLHQAATGRQTPFKRTPKVSARTPTAPLYLVLPVGLLAWCSVAVAWDVLAGRWTHAGTVAVNALLLLYAVGVFVGWRALCADLAGAVRARVTRRRRPLLLPWPPRALSAET